MEHSPSRLSSDPTPPELGKFPPHRDHEGADTAVIAGTVTLVFLTLLVALAVIGLYLFRNRGSYGTGEEPEPYPRREPLDTDKVEYFI